MGSTEQLYNLTWGEFNNSLSNTVQMLRCQSELVDVTLAAGGKIFPAHKLVLGSASPLLMELLKSTKCEHPVIMLAGITAPDLEALLQFVYNGEVSVDPGQLPSLLQAAHCLNIQALSPSILSLDKNGQPMVGPFHDTRPMISPFVSVRKKRKKSSPSCNGDTGGSDACTSKEQQELCRSNLTGDGTPKRPPLVSDLPVSCNICGVTLRQSRNLRRHMELMHLKIGMTDRKTKAKRSHDQSTEGGGGGILGGQSTVDPSPLSSGQAGGNEPPSSRSMDNRMQMGEGGSGGGRGLDGRQQQQQPMMDHRGLSSHEARGGGGSHPGELPPPHYPPQACEPIHPFLHIDPSYMTRPPADLYSRHQQA